MILINGQAGDAISALDRGLQYGDGLFETIAVRNGEPQLWTRHLQRLAAGCRRLYLPPPDSALLTMEAKELSAGSARAVLKVIITRGPGARGYRIQPADPATAAERMSRILMLVAASDHAPTTWRDGVAVRLCELRLGSNPRLAGIKHLNRLEQVLARAEWSDDAIHEGLVRDGEGRVVSGTMSNLFIVRAGRLLTPPLQHCGVAGVMRGLIMDTAHDLGIAVGEAPLWPQDLAAADEVFLSNSLIGIWPVRRIDAQAFLPGPLTQRLAVAIGKFSLMPAGL